MASELYELIARFSPGTTVADVDRMFSDIGRRSRELTQQSIKLGKLDQADVARLQRELQSAIGKAVESPAFGQLSRDSQALLKGAAPDPRADRAVKLQNDLNKATRAYAEAVVAVRAAENSTGKGFFTQRLLDPNSPTNNVIGKAVRATDDQRTPEGLAALKAAERDALARLGTASAARRDYDTARGKRDSDAVLAAQKSAYADMQALIKSGLRDGSGSRLAGTRKSEEQDAGAQAAILQRTRTANARAEAELLAGQKAALAQSQALIKQGLRDGGTDRLSGAQNQQRLAEVDAEARRHAVPFVNPDPSTASGRTRAQVNASTIAVASAEERLAKEYANSSRSVASIQRAEQQLAAATLRLSGARHRLEVLEAPKPKGLVEQFHLGFKGQGDAPYAQQIGQAFKFSVFYGTAYKLLFGLTQTFQATLQEGIQFQQAVTELKLATGRSADSANELANQLGQIATNAGFSASEGALAGARAVGLYGATQSDEATQNSIARTSTRVGTQLAFNSGDKLEDIQTRLAAITNAFELGVDGQEKVADLDAFYARRFGVAPGATIRTVAEVGSVGKQAGFDLNEVNAIAALIMGRTGQTDSAVAGQLAQIFSRGGEGSLKQVGSRYGIDPTQALADQVRQLAAVYQSASPNEQNEIAAAFGRGRVQNTISVLLGSFDEVTRAANDAASGMAKGEADRSFAERVNNIGGEIQLLIADLKEFANLLGQSGILAVLGLGIKTFGELVEAANSILSIWNEIPGTTRSVIASLALLAVALRTQAGQGALSSLAGLGGGVVGRSAGGRLQVGRDAYNMNNLASRRGLSEAASIAVSGAAAALPWVAAAGGLYALGELAGAARDLKNNMSAVNDALGADQSQLQTPEQLRGSADNLRSLGEQAAPQGFWQKALDGLALGGYSDVASREKAAADREAQRREGIASAIEGKPATPAALSLISGFDSTGLSESLSAMNAGGATAVERFSALHDALLRTSDAAGRVAADFNVDETSGKAASPVQAALIKAGGLDGDYKATQGTAARFGFDPAKALGSIQTELLQARLKEILGGLDVAGGGLTEESLRGAAAKLVDTDFLQGANAADSTDPEAFQEYRDNLVHQVFLALRQQTEGYLALLDDTRKLSDEDITAGISGLLQEAKGKLELRPETDLAGRSGILRGFLKTARAAITANRANGGNATPQNLADLKEAQHLLVENEFARLTQLRIVAQQNEKSRKGDIRIGRAALTQMATVAIKNGDVDAIAELIAQLGRSGQKIVIKLIQGLLDKVNAAIKATAQAEGGIFAALRAGNNSIGADLKEKFGLDAALGAAQGTPNDGTGGLGTLAGTDVPGYKPPKEDTAADRKAKAEEARRRGLAIRASLRLLAIDMTDPLALARVAVNDALDAMRHAVDRESRLAARVDVRRARADLEATKFSQRLEAVQTADELGRISHQKYINYLDREKDRLEAVKNRTYQQQQQLDEVERLLKSSAEAMQGQWNFGDIRMPTPYEIRRRVKELYPEENNGISGVINTPLMTSAQNTTIYVNGADVGQVLKIIREYTSGSVSARTGTPRRR